MSSRLTHWYITNRNYLMKGYGEITWLKGLVEFYLLAGVFIKIFQLDGKASFILISALTSALIAFLWLVGFLWDRNKLYHAEQEWFNKRNPFPIEMRSRKKQNYKRKNSL